MRWCNISGLPHTIGRRSSKGVIKSMFVLYADNNRLTVHQREQVTSGSANIYFARFDFSPEWDGMERTACFRSGGRVVSVLLDESGGCTIPWEVMDLDDAGKRLMIGVCGMRDGGVVLPTVWADCGIIQQGAEVGAMSRAPTPGALAQSLFQKADGIQVEGQELRLMAGAKTLASVTLPDPGPKAGEIATDADMMELLDEVFQTSQDNN